MSRVRTRLGELEQRVGVVVVTIAQPDAVVYIDGHEVSRGAGEARVRVLPGPHTLVATLERHETLTRRIDARPGKDVPVDVRLGAERVKVVVQKQRFERPYPTWVPWSTMGAGLVVALAGGMAGQVDESKKDAGELKQTIAISLYALGGAAVATGVVLLFFDRPRPVEAGPAPAASAHLFFDGRSFGVAGTF
jgi:hypothetical protein